MYSFLKRIRKLFATIENQRWIVFNRLAHTNEKQIKKQKELKYLKRCRIALVGIGGVGKSLAHLLKMYPIGLTELRLCSRNVPEGIVEELNHIPTNLPVCSFSGVDKLHLGLKDVDIVILTSGVPRRQGISRKQLFTVNATICTDMINICADMCPDALITIVTNPLDLMVPVAAGVLKKRGVYRPERLFGICQIDQMRAGNFYAEATDQNPRKTYVPVVGGHAENTTVPLFSKARPGVALTEDEIKTLINLVRNAGRQIVLAKKGQGGSTFSMATATLHFIQKLCRAIHDEPHIITSAYVESTVTKAGFFSNELLLGPCGIHKNLGYGTVTKFEQQLIDEAVVNLQNEIMVAEEFIAKDVK